MLLILRTPRLYRLLSLLSLNPPHTLLSPFTDSYGRMVHMIGLVRQSLSCESSLNKRLKLADMH